MPGSVPIHGSEDIALEWLGHRGVDLGSFTPKQTSVFSERSFEPGEAELAEWWDSGAHVSWLGGPAALHDAWPRDASGRPLAHVATFHLADVHAALGEPQERTWPARARALLPSSGYLQVFHDLQSYGYDAADPGGLPWCVTFTPDDRPSDRPALMESPDDLDVPHAITQVGLFLPGWCIPSPLDVPGLTQPRFTAADEATATLDLAWMRQRRPDERHQHAIPSTRMLGYSSSGDALAKNEILPHVLPMSDHGDAYILLLEIESWTTLNGWFGDASSLEVWMRLSDLRGRAFDQAWCLIRTD